MIALKSGSVLLAVSALAVLVQSSGVPDGHPGEIELNRDGCIRHFIERLTQFRIDTTLNELVVFSRRHYGGTFEELVMRRDQLYVDAMRNIPFPNNACNAIFNLYSQFDEDPRCGRYIQSDEEKERFMAELVRLDARAKLRMEVIHACYFAWGGPVNNGRG